MSLDSLSKHYYASILTWSLAISINHGSEWVNVFNDD